MVFFTSHLFFFFCYGINSVELSDEVLKLLSDDPKLKWILNFSPEKAMYLDEFHHKKGRGGKSTCGRIFPSCSQEP